MDLKHIYNDCFIVILLLVFHKGLCFEEDYDDTPSFGRCPWIRNKLKNGRVKIRSRGRIAKFLCDSGYELAGKRFATCVRGQWNNPIPVCVARGCPRTPVIANGRVTEMYRGAMLVYDCNPGYSLDGVVSIYCDGRRWSTEPPACVVAISDPALTCDFEDPDLCGWSHDPTHDFDWKRNQFSTPSGHVGTGPSYDHTFGTGKGGFYMYLEASSPRKENDKARLFSPVYPPDYSHGCFVFWYHMYGATTGGLNVYLKPESHVFSELTPTWDKRGDQGNQWLRGLLDIPPLHENFQIVIEGIRGTGYVGDSAIDDVQLTNKSCVYLGSETDIVAPTVAESCRGRCREREDNSSCGCSDNCYLNENCCNDYATICTSGNETGSESIEEPMPESELGKTSSLLTMTVKNISSLETITESITLHSTSTDGVISPLAVATTITPATIVTSSVFIPPAMSSTSKENLQTSHEVEVNVSSVSSSSTTLSEVSTSTAIKLYSPTIPNFDIKAATEKATSTISTNILETTQSTTYLNTTLSTTNLETTAVKSPASTTAIKTTDSTTTITTTDSTTTVKPTTSITTENTSTTSIQTTSLLNTLSQTTATTGSSIVTTESAIPSSISTTISTAFISSENSSQASIIPLVSTNSNSETTVGISSESSSITSTPSTRKTYNLRPRPNRTTLPVSSTQSNTVKNSSDIIGYTSIPYIIPSSSTELTKAASSQQTSSRNWYKETETRIPYARLTTVSSQYSSRKGLTTTKKPPTSPLIEILNSRFTPQTTSTFKFGIQITTKNTIQKMASTETSLSHASKEASTADKDNLPTTAIIALSIAFILCVAGGLVYYLKQQKNKRQSKLSDDSEMRFLSANEEMEYSDASVLDKILIK